jgi:hypothetical protein
VVGVGVGEPDAELTCVEADDDDGAVGAAVLEPREQAASGRTATTARTSRRSRVVMRVSLVEPMVAPAWGRDHQRR